MVHSCAVGVAQALLGMACSHLLLVYLWPEYRAAADSHGASCTTCESWCAACVGVVPVLLHQHVRLLIGTYL